jgi:hypothetical protein
MNAGILTLGDAGEGEDSLTQFLVKLVSGFLIIQCLHGAC